MHIARTAAASLPLAARAYSHRWLLERDLPSHLPDAMRPSAERIYPKIVDAVGISVKFSLPGLRPAADMVRGAMEAEVMDIYSGRMRDPVRIRARLIEVKERETKRIVGRLRN